MNVYDLKQSIPNKVVQDDGTVTDIFGKAVVSQEIGYNSRRSLPNKWLQPDDTYVTLQEIIAGAVDTELFIIVEELPETGKTNKIYLVPNETGGFTEYIYVNNKWDPIGLISIDLSNYWTIEQVQQAITVALNQAKAYADSLFVDAKSYADGKASSAESNAKDYADTKKSEAITASNQYTDTAIQQSITQVLGGSY